MSDDRPPVGDDPEASNLISGQVDGPAFQVRDIHGNITIGSGPAIRPVPRQLPPTPPDFVDRITELDWLTAQAEASCAPIVVFHPAEGVGKTALVVRWAQTQIDRFSDGLLYVNLRGSDRSGLARRSIDAVRDVLLTFSDALPQGQDAQLAAYRMLFDGKQILLVLDDARDAEQVRPLLPPGAGSLAVITSRHQLGNLAGFGGRSLPLDVLDRDNASELLRGRLDADRVDAEPDAFTQLVELCGGLPGALGTLAGATNSSTLARVVAELDADPDVRAAIDLAARARAIQRWYQAKAKSEAPSPPWRISTEDHTWLHDRRLLIGVGVAACIAISLVSTHFFEKSGVLGFGYFFLRFALLGAGLTYLEREGPMAALAAGAVTGSAIYFMVDAFTSINSDAGALTWLELLAVIAFVVLLWVRVRPIQRWPRRPRIVPPGSRPVAFAIIGGLLAWFVLLFVGVQYDAEYGLAFTLVSQVGVLGAFIPVLTVGSLCAAVALLELDESQGLFVSAATVAYFVPEALLLLGSLALGNQFAYYSDGFWASVSVPWFTIAQATVALTLTACTLIIVRGRRA